MTEAAKILSDALARARDRDERRVPVDYDALNKMVKRQRAALTRALNSKDRDRVVLACRDAVREWDRPGSMWPDDWSRWQRALDDVLPLDQMVSLDDLR
jgi:hypothetical protein